MMRDEGEPNEEKNETEMEGVFRVDIVDEPKQYAAREASGIYVIRMNKPVRRIGGIDRRGILYIGQAND